MFCFGFFSSRAQEQELLARISDLQAEVCSRNNRITDLDHEIHSLNETIDTLTRELEHKGKEVLRVRSEANHQIRYGNALIGQMRAIKKNARRCLRLRLIPISTRSR